MSDDESRKAGGARGDAKLLKKQPGLIRQVNTVSASGQAYAIQVDLIDENGIAISNARKYYIVDGYSIFDTYASSVAGAVDALVDYLASKNSNAVSSSERRQIAENLIQLLSQVMADNQRAGVRLIDQETKRVVGNSTVYRKEGGRSVEMENEGVFRDAGVRVSAPAGSESVPPGNVSRGDATPEQARPVVAKPPRSPGGRRRR